MVTVEELLCRLRELHEKIMGRKEDRQRRPLTRLDYVITKLQITIAQNQHKEEWKRILKSAEELRGLSEKQPRDEGRAKEMMQELVRDVEDELPGLEILFNLENLKGL